MKKIFITVIVLLLLGLAGCGKNTHEPDKNNEQTNEQTNVANDEKTETTIIISEDIKLMSTNGIDTHADKSLYDVFIDEQGNEYCYEKGTTTLRIINIYAEPTRKDAITAEQVEALALEYMAKFVDIPEDTCLQVQKDGSYYNVDFVQKINDITVHLGGLTYDDRGNLLCGNLGFDAHLDEQQLEKRISSEEALEIANAYLCDVVGESFGEYCAEENRENIHIVENSHGGDVFWMITYELYKDDLTGYLLEVNMLTGECVNFDQIK